MALHKATDTPQLEAQVLLAHVMGWSRTALLAHPEFTIPADQRSRFQAMICRRAAGYPLPYLTSQIEFYCMMFTVTPDVLIPRPETEDLVDLARQHQPRAVVDVGTGSGCVAVSLAAHLPEARLIATDLSAPALRVASANAHTHGVRDRIRLVQCDLIGALAGPVDLVVANPPYVSEAERHFLSPSVGHEPALALDGGPDGLAVIRRLLAEAPRVLRPGGALLVEIGATQGQAAAGLAHALFPDARVFVHPDLAGRDRVLDVQFAVSGHRGSATVSIM